MFPETCPPLSVHIWAVMQEEGQRLPTQLIPLEADDVKADPAKVDPADRMFSSPMKE